MFKRIVLGVLMATVLTTGSILAGQNTGGDKGSKTTAAAPGLNPQPLPPGGIVITGVIVVIGGTQTR